MLEWFGQNARDLPWRRTQDPYAIWIAEIMLQQTQVKTVAAYWQRWMRALPDARAFARAKSAQVHKLWEGLGYYARVRNAHAAARVMVEKHGGQFPPTFAGALALPGVGRYTAGAVCSIAYNHPTPILDGNVTRVLSRVFGVGGEPRGKKANGRLWRLAEELVSVAAGLPSPGPAKADRFSPAPKPAKTARIFSTAKAVPDGADSGKPPRGNCGRLNEALMELGALICKPKQPACAACPLRRVCVARAANRVAEIPEGQASREGGAPAVFGVYCQPEGTAFGAAAPGGRGERALVGVSQRRDRSAGKEPGGRGRAVCLDSDEAGLPGAALDHAPSDIARGLPGAMAGAAGQGRRARGVADAGAVGTPGDDQRASENSGRFAG